MRRGKSKKSLVNEIQAMEEDLGIEIFIDNQKYEDECEVTGKKKYRSNRKAMSAIRRRQRNGAGKLRTYMCEHCSTFHISSSFHQ